MFSNFHFTKVFAALFVVALLLTAMPMQHASAQTPDPNATLSLQEQGLLDQINAARTQAGLGKLVVNPQIEAIARSRSTDMATRQYFAHVTPEGTTFIDMVNALNIWYSNIGEIINRNSYADAETVKVAFTSYMNSPLHKSYIMTKEYSDVGVGIAVDKNGVKYYTVIFLAK